MFVRQGSFEVVPGKLDALRETYNRDCQEVVAEVKPSSPARPRFARTEFSAAGKRGA